MRIQKESLIDEDFIIDSLACLAEDIINLKDGQEDIVSCLMTKSDIDMKQTDFIKKLSDDAKSLHWNQLNLRCRLENLSDEVEELRIGLIIFGAVMVIWNIILSALIANVLQ